LQQLRAMNLWRRDRIADTKIQINFHFERVEKLADAPKRSDASGKMLRTYRTDFGNATSHLVSDIRDIGKFK
jgi:hypothetical protein